MSGMSTSQSWASTSCKIAAGVTHSGMEVGVISMDFITDFPQIKKKNDSIFVVINKLSKEAHFIPVKSTYKTVNIAEIFLK